MIRGRSILSIVCCALFLLTCFVGVSDEAAAKPLDARGTVEFRTASGSDAEEYYLGETVYIYIKCNDRAGALGPRFNCRVTDSQGGTQYEEDFYSDGFETTETFITEQSDPTGTWKVVLKYFDHLTPPNGLRLDTDTVEVLVSEEPELWSKYDEAAGTTASDSS
ncbi:MAG: hypothetical protein JSV90_09350, partial [Methanobacteriota archaeon]